MKTTLTLFALIFFAFEGFEGFSNSFDSSKNICFKTSHSEHKSQENSNPLQIVYICTGSYSYAYHSRSDCAGLGNCSAEIKYTDENTASYSFGRVPCCRCWANVAGRCRDDNTYAGGGSGSGENSQSKSDAYAYMALAMVAASAIILSNDFYVYPTLSFYSPEVVKKYQSKTETGLGKGWSLGFRKTFTRCALEYGTSYIKMSRKNSFWINSYWDSTNTSYQYSNLEELKRWGGHLNFVHHIFYEKTPDWLKIYAGPTINYVYDFGAGAILGAEIKLFDRLRFDARYELTSQTNQVQFGLIVNYQKKYFWEK